MKLPLENLKNAAFIAADSPFSKYRIVIYAGLILGKTIPALYPTIAPFDSYPLFLAPPVFAVFEEKKV
jgi:hypothetical protein